MALLVGLLLPGMRPASANSDYKHVAVTPNCNGCTRVSYTEYLMDDGSKVQVNTQVWWSTVNQSSFYVTKIKWTVYAPVGIWLRVPAFLVWAAGGTSSGPSYERRTFDSGQDWCATTDAASPCGTGTLTPNAWYSGGATREDGIPSTSIGTQFGHADVSVQDGYYTTSHFYIDTPGDRWDMDGDGRSDVATVTNNSASNANLNVLHSTGGGFNPPSLWRGTTWNWTGVKALVGDVDFDGKSDLVTLNNNGSSGTSMHALTSYGSGFDPPSTWRTTTWGWGGIKPLMGDINGDGKADLVTLNNNGSTSVQGFLSTGRSFAAPTEWRSMTWGWTGIKPLMGDVNGDGKDDLVTLNNNGASGTSFHAMLSNGTSGFGSPSTRSTTWNWTGIKAAMGDVNGDKKDDIVTLNNNAGLASVQVLLSTGTSFGAPTTWRSTTYAWSGLKPFVADVDRNGRADLVTVRDDGSSGTSMRVFLSTGAAPFLAPANWRQTSWIWGGVTVPS